MTNQHLFSAKEIASTFGVSLRTVRAWRQHGAPIIRVGKRCQASYPLLFDWLMANEENLSRWTQDARTVCRP